eukprot:TRINITY_DN1371_c0_g2_i1.p1 TRINITY_DN1371_c0_g2~~TRINITY_DN1371_c0_g2_i1.p1  ORF type:complete len:232 (+),score=87.39 TRINITY_DN1371_c0_g2_i1:109-804(+)
MAGSIFQGMGMRGGNRGREFSWEDVQGDKYKECYLGQSLNIRQGGRIQTGPKPQWWYKEASQPKAGSVARQGAEELARIKAEEEQLMKEALGLAPKRRKIQAGTGLEKHEFVELCRRGQMERDDLDTDRVGGVGTYFAEQSVTAVDKDSLPQSEPAKGKSIFTDDNQVWPTTRPKRPHTDGDDEKGDSERHKKDKKDKKERKKEKKERKKEKKERKEERRRDRKSRGSDSD